MHYPILIHFHFRLHEIKNVRYSIALISVNFNDEKVQKRIVTNTTLIVFEALVLTE